MGTRHGQWKLVEGGKLFDGAENGNKALTGDDALFLSDLNRDPGETTNLRRQHPEIVDKLSTSSHQWPDQVKKN